MYFLFLYFVSFIIVLNLIAYLLRIPWSKNEDMPARFAVLDEEEKRKSRLCNNWLVWMKERQKEWEGN
jgi:hypothetical protein